MTNANRWHSWDPSPWDYPWLSSDNLTRMKEFSNNMLADLRARTEKYYPKELNFGFCGNIANSMYNRARPISKSGYKASMILHPHDTYAMSQPYWEFYDDEISRSDLHSVRFRDNDDQVLDIDSIVRLEEHSDGQQQALTAQGNFLPAHAAEQFVEYMPFYQSLRDLSNFDALWCTQYPYIGYLANRPFVASQSGGDLWLECSRNDNFGLLQRTAFGGASMIMASNPWSFAHARRFGYRHMIYLPRVLDENVYAPGTDEFRQQWKAQIGGDFFVLSTSRIDERNKGSSIGIEGFAKFAAENSQARLILIGWGEDSANTDVQLERLGIKDKTLTLQVAGKPRLVRYLRSCDVFLDQFVLGYFGSAGLEAMACGLPVLGRIEEEQYEAICETGAPPILNCDNATEVCQELMQISDSENRLLKVGEASRTWFVDNHSGQKWVDSYVAALTITAYREFIDFRESPLTEPLSKEEYHYLAEGIAAAPDGDDYGW